MIANSKPHNIATLVNIKCAPSDRGDAARAPVCDKHPPADALSHSELPARPLHTRVAGAETGQDLMLTYRRALSGDAIALQCLVRRAREIVKRSTKRVLRNPASERCAAVYIKHALI